QTTGVTVTDTLPQGVNFVSADTPQGTWSIANGVVTFHLGLLEEASLQLTVTVMPTQPGQIANTVRIRANEQEQSVSNNSSTVTSTVQGAALPQAVAPPSQAQPGVNLNGANLPVLAAVIGDDGQVHLAVQGEVGASYRVEV